MMMTMLSFCQKDSDSVRMHIDNEERYNEESDEDNDYEQEEEEVEHETLDV